ncbi:MAG: YmfQ family protein, partial [Oscillospiraceae bacterium]|nr:YmfQ family protein [Oscillospiraceae bacterium]
ADYVRNQMFVITAGDGGLARFERLLGITPADGESIETRRANVLMQWDSETPHTMRYLIALLEVLTGGDFEIDERFWISQMDIKITAPDIDVAMLLANLKRYIIPVNLTVNVLAFFRTWDMLWDKNMTLQQLWDRNMTLDEVGTEAMR